MEVLDLEKKMHWLISLIMNKIPIKCIYIQKIHMKQNTNVSLTKEKVQA